MKRAKGITTYTSLQNEDSFIKYINKNLEIMDKKGQLLPDFGLPKNNSIPNEIKEYIQKFNWEFSKEQNKYIRFEESIKCYEYKTYEELRDNYFKYSQREI